MTGRVGPGRAIVVSFGTDRAVPLTGTWSKPMRWVGIDEAGYGPNLGPLVMTAVVAESAALSANGDAGGRARVANVELDLWRELAASIDRAGGDPARLWVDDSKAILKGGKGRERLERACLAAVHAAGGGLAGSLAELLTAACADDEAEAELSPWFGVDDRYGQSASARSWPWKSQRAEVEELLARGPLAPVERGWRIVEVRSVVVGPARFNRELLNARSKADVHFGAFARLLRAVWDRAADGATTRVTGDKHGGRHYYMGPLASAFDEAWIHRGAEGPLGSRYTIRDAGRTLELNLVPRADGQDGLTALASIVSKTVRELWMDGFNAYWRTRSPGLRPTAGYPVDARRFRAAIEAAALAEGHSPETWWRVR